MIAVSAEFQEAFGAESGIEGCDFRPHFDGELYNAFRVVSPAPTRDAHMTLAWDAIREMATWILSRKDQFQSGDRFQLIIGWPENVRTDSRQIIKIGGGFDEVARVVQSETYEHYQQISGVIVFRSGWDTKVF